VYIFTLAEVVASGADGADGLASCPMTQLAVNSTNGTIHINLRMNPPVEVLTAYFINPLCIRARLHRVKTTGKCRASAPAALAFNHCIPQGLKPIIIFRSCDMTEVVPCYKTCL
jgi:hypothetical protein